jgi:3-deoxy-manno-octulosonate cytidylyltransferase (CMP-KDO synthetase)
MKVTCVIPARLSSTRLPKKVLALLHGKPLLQWVVEAAKEIPLFSEIVVATDHADVEALAQDLDVPCYLTSPECISGTERLIELKRSGKVTADIWVNWQGDEPFITQEMIGQLLQTAPDDFISIWTLRKKISDTRSIHSPDVVKVVCDEEGKALYFSRAPIPFPREGHSHFYKHIGLYAFTDEALYQISDLPPTALELSEKLEQLRFLGHGLPIRVHETFTDPLGINTPEELAMASSLVASSNQVR